jgi:hypothetical protein
MSHQRLRIGVLAGMALLPLAMTGCATVASVKAEMPRQAPEVNVTGVWESRDWDRTFLNQSGSDVSGQIGNYKVDGLVVGKDVYLFLSDGPRVFHSMKLAIGTPPPPAAAELIGYYYYDLHSYADMQPDSSTRRYPTIFRKTSDTAPPK